MQDDMEMARRLGSGQEGVLTVGFSGSVMLTTLPKAIERYRRLFPKVELRLREVVTAEQAPSLLDGTLDLGVPSRWRTARWTVDGVDSAGAISRRAPGSSQTRRVCRDSSR
ncbi:MAG: LysR substrate-binding domain-containing protein [Candidatus Sulfotelmatobacter sp.]